MAAVLDLIIAATATPILTGTSSPVGPKPILANRSDETITLTFAQSVATYPLGPAEMLRVPHQAVVTGTAAGGAAQLQVLRHLEPIGAGGAAAASFDESTGSLRITRLNPDWTQRGPIQEEASGLGDGTYQIYFDLEDFKYFFAYLKITAGLGSWSWKCYSTTLNDGTAAASVPADDWRDRTARWFGVQQMSGSSDFAFEFEKDTPTAAKYIKLEGVRTGEPAGGSGAYKADIDRSY